MDSLSEENYEKISKEFTNAIFNDIKSELKLNADAKTTSKTKHKQNKSVNYSTSNSRATTLCDYEAVTESEKLKKNYMKKYIILENRINTLKRQEKEMETKLSAFKKKEKNREMIKNTKNEFKKQVIENRERKQRLFTEQKEKVKSLKESEQERLNTLQEINSQKKKLLFEISKTDQNLVKTMISQSITKNQAINKYKYLQIKENKERFKQNSHMNQIKKETEKKIKNKQKYEQNMQTAEELKQKCEELERLEDKYIKNLQTTRMKTNSFIENIVEYLLSSKIGMQKIDITQPMYMKYEDFEDEYDKYCKEVKDIFLKYDVDFDHLLSRSEFNEFIKWLVPYLEEKEYDEVFERMDTKKDGVIDYKEFKSGFKELMERTRIRNVIKTIKTIT